MHPTTAANTLVLTCSYQQGLALEAEGATPHHQRCPDENSQLRKKTGDQTIVVRNTSAHQSYSLGDRWNSLSHAVALAETWQLLGRNRIKSGDQRCY